MGLLSDQRIGKFLAGEHVSDEAEDTLRHLEAEFDLYHISGGQKVMRALAACRLGVPPESVAKFLDWREFERFCASLLRARGYSVTENITLTKPRVQIDILARTRSLALLVDCKHWRHGMGTAALVRAASAQAERAKVIRERMRDLEPLAVVLLILSNEQARFVEGAAIVPIYTLGSFLSNPDAYSDLLEFY